MTRAELLEHICFTNYTNECSAVDGRYNCQDCKDAINPLLDEYDEQIRADAERDFQNSDEWNDYLAKVIADAKADVFNSLNNNCKYSHFTFDMDSHCSGYNYCTLKGFDCVCCFENCAMLME